MKITIILTLMSIYMISPVLAAGKGVQPYYSYERGPVDPAQEAERIIPPTNDNNTDRERPRARPAPPPTLPTFSLAKEDPEKAEALGVIPAKRSISGCEGGSMSADGEEIHCPNGDVYIRSGKASTLGRNINPEKSPAPIASTPLGEHAGQ